MRLEVFQFFTVKALIAALLFVSSPASSSDVSAIQMFQDSAKVIPALLHNLGYKRLGPLNFREIYEGIDNIEVNVAEPEEIHDMNGGHRIGARWEKNPDPIVHISRYAWNQKYVPSVHPVLALHEYLGIYGFNDHDYTLSSTLWLLADDRVQESFTREEKGYLEKVIRLQTKSAGGGVIGVGGGGDDFSIGKKISLINKSVDSMLEASSRADREKELRWVFFWLEFALEPTWETN